MHPAYFGTRFRTLDPAAPWPEAFVIITAYATTGASWTEDENQAADRRLAKVLEDAGHAIRRVTGFSPTTGHAEPGWAVSLPFGEACDLGERFHQDALYAVEGDALFVSYCDARRSLVPVGSFRERVVGG